MRKNYEPVRSMTVLGSAAAAERSCSCATTACRDTGEGAGACAQALPAAELSQPAARRTTRLSASSTVFSPAARTQSGTHDCFSTIEDNVGA